MAMALRKLLEGFNTQPPEGGWYVKFNDSKGIFVSTHSRPKAAGQSNAIIRAQ